MQVLERIEVTPSCSTTAGGKTELLITPSNAGAIPQFSREATRIAVTLITCVSCYEVLKSLLFNRQ